MNTISRQTISSTCEEERNITKNDTIEKISKMDIPKMLKDYFLRNKHIDLLIDDNLLVEIEDLYIEYDSLYEFDESEFCSYVITCIKKQDKHDYFYHYLKKVLDSNLSTTSKKKNINTKKLTQLDKIISAKLDENDIPQLLMSLLNLIEDYKNSKKVSNLFNAYTLNGVLKVFFTLYPKNSFLNAFNRIQKKLTQIDLD